MLSVLDHTGTDFPQYTGKLKVDEIKFEILRKMIFNLLILDKCFIKPIVSLRKEHRYF